MWQPIIAGLIVIAAGLYAARALGPRRWRRKRTAANTKGTGPCGCGNDDGGCH